MGILDIVKDESERLDGLLNFYVQKISEFPKGHINEKKRGGNLYVYLNYRAGTKVQSTYIGVKGSPADHEVRDQLVARQKYEVQLKEVKARLKEARHALGRRK